MAGEPRDIIAAAIRKNVDLYAVDEWLTTDDVLAALTDAGIVLYETGFSEGAVRRGHPMNCPDCMGIGAVPDGIDGSVTAEMASDWQMYAKGFIKVCETCDGEGVFVPVEDTP